MTTQRNLYFHHKRYHKDRTSIEMALPNRHSVFFLLQFLHLLQYKSSINGELIQGSDNTLLVQKGNDFMLACQATVNEATDGIRLRHESQPLYQSFPPAWHDENSRDERYHITKPSSPSGFYNLTVSNAREKDAGIYMCEIIQNPDLSWIYRVYVLDQPELEVLGQKEGENLTVTCQAEYTEVKDYTLKPRFEVFYANTTIKAIGEVEFDREGRRIIASQRFLRVTKMKKEDNGQELTCKISSEDSSTNINTSINLDVQYSPRYLEIGDIKPAYKLGDLIRCTGEGNPPPILQWVSKKGEVREGRILAITSEMTESQSWRCISLNHPTAESKEHAFDVEWEFDPLAVILFQCVVVFGFYSIWLSSMALERMRQICENRNDKYSWMKTCGYLMVSSGILGMIIVSLQVFLEAHNNNAYLRISDFGKLQSFTGCLVLLVGASLHVIAEIYRKNSQIEDPHITLWHRCKLIFKKAEDVPERTIFHVVYKIINQIPVVGIGMVAICVRVFNEDDDHKTGVKTTTIIGLYIALYGAVADFIADVFFRYKAGQFRDDQMKSERVRSHGPEMDRLLEELGADIGADAETNAAVRTLPLKLSTENSGTGVRHRLRRKSW